MKPTEPPIPEQGLSAAALRGSEPRLDDDHIVTAVHEYLTALEAGKEPDRAEFLARHPAIADELTDCLEGLDFVHQLGPRRTPAVGHAPELPSSSAEVVAEVPLGDYRIVREIGHGGMGVVYEAVQLSLGRRVALKILPFAAALDGRQLQRFKSEAQAAALLHHTNIVPIYGVGVERGIHYYAMQFIEGKTLADLIEEFRQKAGLKTVNGTVINSAVDMATETTRQPATVQPSSERASASLAFCRMVAGLGVQAAEALEHAHQSGVIHRDVKPGNLLVDGRGNLWITDFGLAHMQSHAALTMTGDLVGTLRYMSPEQALAKRVIVDHRTDIYSLGTTLYELLTLEPAFAGQDRQELLRQIAFEEPKAPRRLNRAIPPELETILAKAMEKNPSDRYATAQELADDLRRFLDDKPIRARRPSALTRVRKWCRRHRGAVSAAVVATLLVLPASSAVIVWQWRVAETRRAQAEQAEKKAQAVNDFLIREMIRAAHPFEARGRKLTVEEVLDRASAKIGAAFPKQPDVEAAVQMAIGQAYDGLGLTAKAEPHLLRALELRQRLLGEEHPDTLKTMEMMARLRILQGRPQEAEALYQKALAGARRILGEEHPTTLNLLYELAYALDAQGRWTEAEGLYRECFDTERRVLGPEDGNTLRTMANLASLLAEQARFPEAEALARDCLAVRVRAHGDDAPETVHARSHVVYVLTAAKVPDAEVLSRANLHHANRLWGPDNSWTLLFANEHAHALLLQDKFDAAEQIARRSLRTRLEMADPDQVRIADCRSLLGDVFRGRGRWLEATEELRQALKCLQQVYGTKQHPNTWELTCVLGAVLRDSGKRAEARTLLRRALEEQRKILRIGHPYIALSLYEWAEYLLDEDDARQAEPALREALAIQRQVMPTDQRALGQTLASLGWALRCNGKAREGEQPLREGLEICRRRFPDGHRVTATVETRLGGCLTALGQLAEAEELLLRSHPILEKAPGTPPQRVVEAANRLVELYEAWGKADQAAAWRLKRDAEKRTLNKPGP
jgi:serine/threonine protein kinase